jgi:hypothetical protein
MIDFPANPLVGQIFSAGSGMWRWTGTKWVAYTPSSGGMAVAISDTPPANPPPGLMWFRSDTGVLYIRYPDPDSSQWLAVTQGAAGPAGPPGQWVQVTQAQYNALSPPNPSTLYVIIG